MQDTFSLRFARAALLAGGAAIALSACAAIPRLDPAPKPKTTVAFASNESLAAPTADWPDDHWWTAYGDPQLNQLVDEALAGSPNLTQAEARLRQARAVAEETGSTLLPQIGAEASVGGVKQSYNQGIPPALVPHGWRDAGRVGLDLDWHLDLFGKARSRLAAATSETEAKRAEVAAARLGLSTAVAGSYAQLSDLHAGRDAALDAKRVRLESETLVAARVRRGLENEGSLERAKAARAATEAELAAIDEAIGLTKNQIAALLGAGPDRGLHIERPAPGAIKAFGLPTSLKAELVGRRPDVTAARLTAEAASKRISAAKAEFYPDIDLMGVIGMQSLGLNMLTKSGSTFGQVGPAVTLPIFTAGRLEGAYRGARAQYDEAVAAYDQTLTQALKEVADSAVSARALGDRLAKTREALTAAQTAYQLNRDRYSRGLGTYLDVLSAEDALISSRRAVADLEARAFVLDVSLIHALGGGYRA
jgi:NodT family efflux transporter outer membrane factor (OMF) lipoprotein